MMNEAPTEKNENKKPIMSKSMVVVAVNIVVFIIYTIYSRAGGPNSEGGIALALFIALQVVVNIIAGIGSLLANSKPYSSGFFLSAVLILLIGVSTCFTIF